MAREPRFLESSVRDIKCGEGVTIVKPCNIYECTLDDGVFVGPFVEIQKGAKVGARTRVQSHVFICDMVTIGEDCFISHGVMFINDLAKRGTISREPKDWVETVVGNKVCLGTNSTILPVRICDNAVIGAGSVVTKDITEPGFYSGNPAKKMDRELNVNCASSEGPEVVKKRKLEATS